MAYSLSKPKCLICLNNYTKPSKRRGNNGHADGDALFEEQLTIIYFLRRLSWTPVPVEELRTFVKIGENPTEWAGFCRSCEYDVRKCLELHREVLEIVGRISEIRWKLLEQVKKEDKLDKKRKKVPLGGKCRNVEDVFSHLRYELCSSRGHEGFDKQKALASVGISYYRNSSDLEGVARSGGTPVPIVAGPGAEEAALSASYVKQEPLIYDDDLDNDNRDDDDDDPEFFPHFEDFPADNLKHLDDEASAIVKEEEEDEGPVFTAKRDNNNLRLLQRRRRYDYILNRTFDNLSEAQAYLTSDKYLRKRREYNLPASGVRKIFYYCHIDYNCPLKAYLELELDKDKDEEEPSPSGSGPVKYFSTNYPHQHGAFKRYGLLDEEKKKIQELISLGITLPKRIFVRLKREGYHELSVRQIRAYLNYERRKKRPSGWFKKYGKRRKGTRGRSSQSVVKDEPSSEVEGETLSSSSSSKPKKKYYNDLSKRPQPPGVGRRRFNWEVIKTFDNLEEAKAFVKAEKKWQLRQSRTTVTEGTKVSYDCGRDRNCDAKLKLYQDCPGGIVDLSSTGLEHTHEDYRKSGLSDEEKSKIKEIMATGVSRPRLIFSALRLYGLDPGLAKINAYVSYNVRRKGKPKKRELESPEGEKRRRGRPRIHPVQEKDDNDKNKDSHSQAPEGESKGSGSKGKGKPKRRFDWYLIKSFNSVGDAKAHIFSEKMWTNRSTLTTTEGKKFIYDCKHGRDCPAKIYLLERDRDLLLQKSEEGEGHEVEGHQPTKVVHLYSTNEQHNHSMVQKVWGLLPEEKERIRKLHEELGVRKPKKILEALRMEGMIRPDLKSIVSYVHYNLRRMERKEEKEDARARRIVNINPKGRKRGRKPKNKINQVQVEGGWGGGAQEISQAELEHCHPPHNQVNINFSNFSDNFC